MPLPVAIVWLVNGAAFWVAEILTSPTPRDAEPAWVLAVALAGYLAVGAAGAVLSRLVIARTRLRAVLSERWIAFVPGALLFLPVAWYALGVELRETALLLALLAAAAVVLALAWRRARIDDAWTAAIAYGCGSLALWSIALSIRGLAADVPLVAPTIVASSWTVPWAVGGLFAVALALAVVPARVAPLGIAAVAIVAGRIVVPSWVGAASHAEAAESHAPRDAGPVPVVLIVLDTTRADHLSVYGYRRRTTPELEEFARHAVVFDHAIASSPWTLPSHASLFTGLFALRHGADRPHWLAADSAPGALRPGLPLDARYVTLASVLREHGYDTGGVASNFGYLDPAFGLDRGIGFYDAAPNTPITPRLLALVHRRIAALPWAARYWRMYRRAEQVNRSALAWLAGRRSDAVFLFLNYMEPHRPWTAPGLHYDAFAAERDAPPTALRAGAVGDDARELVDLYDSQVAALDHAVGELFAGLHTLGLWDRALVVVTADHGESLGEHGVVGHGQSLHEPELVVPLLVKYPGSARTGRRAGRVQLVDVFPSILAELGFDVPPGLDGGPLDAVSHPILAEFYTDPRAAEDVRRGYQAALYDGPRKLVVDDAGRAELFDIEHDPSETRPLPPPLPGALAEREAWLRDRQRTLEEALRARGTTIEPVDPSVEKALRALGYVGK